MTKKPLFLFVLGEDDYFLSHRLPAAYAAVDAGFLVKVYATDTGKSRVIEKLGFQFFPAKIPRGELGTFAIKISIIGLVKIFWIHKPKAVQFVGLKNVFIGQIAALFKPKMHVINGINGLGLLFGNSTPIMKLLRFISIGFLAAVSRIHTPTFLFQNEDDQRQLRRFGISLAKSYIIPGSGVDRKIFKPTTLPSFTHQLIIGMACRLIKIKGIAEIARAMDLLHQQGVHATLRLAGDVDEMNPHSCSKEQVEALRNRPNIELHGYVEDMAAFWSKCHIAVLPSLGGEGVPMALLQPASMGRALLTTDTNGNRDICVDRSNGFLVRPGSVEALTSRIKEFSENPQLIAKMGSQSAKHIEQGGFSSESVHSMLKTVYSAVLKNLS